MPSPDDQDPQVQIALRLPAELLRRVDAHVERLRARAPGLTVSRAGVIRAALHEVLDAAEGGDSSPPT